LPPLPAMAIGFFALANFSARSWIVFSEIPVSFETLLNGKRFRTAPDHSLKFLLLDDSPFFVLF